jgi:hypothetical protein
MRSRRLLLLWLVVVATLGCGATLTLALTARVYRRHWDTFTPPLVEEFGPDNQAPDFTLRDLDGESFHLALAAARTPIVLEIGSFT